MALRNFLTFTIFVLLLPLQSVAQDNLQRLNIALAMPEILGIMRDEGLAYGHDLDRELLGGAGGAEWQDSVSEVYDLDRMTAEITRVFDRELPETAIGPLIAFFESGPGKAIISLEIAARTALLDKEVERASLENLRRMRATNDPRLSLIGQYIEANDLIESNVVGAMNSNFAFYLGLAQGGAFPPGMTEDQILRDVWRQEDEIRADTADWLYSYLAMAYRPLADADLKAYVALSVTEEGQALNRALFVAFDEMFVRISRELGLAAAGRLGGQDI